MEKNNANSSSKSSQALRFILPFCGRFAVSYARTCVYCLCVLSMYVCVCCLGECDYALVCLKQKICLSYYAHLYAMLAALRCLFAFGMWHVASRT